MTVRERVVDALIDKVNRRGAWTDWYRKNACAVHGVEYDEISNRSHVSAVQPKQDDGPQQPQPQHDNGSSLDDLADRIASRIQPATSNGPEPKSGSSDASNSSADAKAWWQHPSAIAAAIIAAGAIGTASIPYVLAPASGDTPPVVVPANDVGLTLLQDLEERGYHLADTEAEQNN